MDKAPWKVMVVVTILVAIIGCVATIAAALIGILPEIIRSTPATGTQIPALTVTTRPPQPTALLLKSAADGKIVYRVQLEQSQPGQQYMMNPDGTDIRPFTTGWGDVRVPHISIDGQRMLSPEQTIKDDENSVEIFVSKVDGSEKQRLTNDSNNDGVPVWSPDDKYIYFTSKRSGYFEIVRMLPDGSNQEQLTRSGTDNALGGCDFPLWSPTDGRIAFTSFRDGNAEIYAMNPDGSGQVRLTNDPATNICPTWSPDGKRIAFVSTAGKAGTDFYSSVVGNTLGDIYVMAADGSNMTKLTDGAHVYWPSGLVWLR